MQTLPKCHQSMIVSTKMHIWVQRLLRKYVNDPVVIDIVGEPSQNLAEGISLYSIDASTFGKRSILNPLVTEYAKGGKCIFFTQTKQDADSLWVEMSQVLACEPFQGNTLQDVFYVPGHI